MGNHQEPLVDTLRSPDLPIDLGTTALRKPQQAYMTQRRIAYFHRGGRIPGERLRTDLEHSTPEWTPAPTVWAVPLR